MKPDAILEEIYRIRKEILEEVNYDPQAYSALLKKVQEEERAAGRTIIKLTPAQEKRARLAIQKMNEMAKNKS